MREGFWKADKQGGPQEEEYSRMSRSDGNRFLLSHGLMAEAKRYVYTNRVSGLLSEAEEALSDTLRFVWEGRMFDGNSAVNLIQDVAHLMEQSNMVETAQRSSV